MRILWIAVVSGLLLAGCGSPGEADRATDVPPQRFANPATVILDVRTPEEYAAGHLVGATNVPVNTVAERIESVVPDKGTPIVVHCRSGRRSGIATEALKGLGYTNVFDAGTLERAQEVAGSR